MSAATGNTDRLAALLLGLPALRPAAARSARDPGDPVLADAESAGERLVAHLRLLVATAVLVLQLILGGASGGREAAGLLAGAFWLCAAAVHVLVTRDYRRWLALLSCALDVTAVSAALAVLSLGAEAGGGRAAGFELYFLAIGCAGLRYDWKLTGLTGLLAVAQYAALAAGAASWLGPPAAAALREGWPERLLVLGAATVVSAAVVVRAKRLRHLSTTDPLTGLANRAVFDERLAAERQRSFRHGRPLAVAVVDVDRFKRFNDAHGHPAGDAALRAVADTLRRSVRQSDLVARLGGEEFALILPETTPAAALVKLDAIRHAVADVAIPVPRRWMPQYVTISGGVAGWPEDDGLDAAGLLSLADERLYRAKACGRDRVVGSAAGRPGTDGGAGPQ